MSCRIANSRYFDWLCLSPSTISFRASLAWVPHANRIEALHYCNFLWPPYRAGHYILQLWFVSSFFFFSSPILSGLRLDVCHTFTHDVALVQITQKKSPSEHHRTMLSGYIFASEAYIDNRKNVFKQQYLIRMSSQYGELRPTNGWDRLASLGHPCSKFQRVSRLGFVIALTSIDGGRPNFARWLAVSWADTRHFSGLLPSNGILPNEVITKHPTTPKRVATLPCEIVGTFLTDSGRWLLLVQRFVSGAGSSLTDQLTHVAVAT